MKGVLKWTHIFVTQRFKKVVARLLVVMYNLLLQHTIIFTWDWNLFAKSQAVLE